MSESNKQPIEYTLIDEIKEMYPYLISVIGVLMNKINNVYTIDKNLEKSIQSKIKDWNLANNNSWVKKMLVYLIRETEIDEETFFCHENWIIPFQNGYYDAKIPKFKINKDKKFFYEIPHPYNEDFKGDCPIFKASLKEYLEDQQNVNVCKVDDIFEIMAYCMTMNTNLKKAFYIFGPTHTAKTTFQTILLHLLGDKNIANISLWRMQLNQFGTDGLQLKILNTVGETKDNKIKDISDFKQLTGGDKWIYVEIKGVRQGRFINYVKMLFMGNKLPSLVDRYDQAFYGRWILINFAHQFKVSRYNFSDYIINDPNEIQGILHKCVKGLRRLHERGDFRQELIQNNQHIWNYNTDNFYRFIHDKCVFEKDAKIRKTKLVSSYVNYVVKNELGIPISDKAITKELRNYNILGRLYGKVPSYHYFGIKLKTKSELKPKKKEEIKEEKVIKEPKDADYDKSFERWEDEQREQYELGGEKSWEETMYDALTPKQKALIDEPEEPEFEEFAKVRKKKDKKGYDL